MSVKRQDFRTRICGVLLLGLLSLACFSGCMKRRILLRSQPEGALVTIDHQTIGHTPVAIPFTYYAGRKIEMEKDGYETEKFTHRFSPPWYQIPPFDLISDNFLGREIRDQRLIDVQLRPKATVFENQLLERSDQLRANVGRGTVAMPFHP